MKALLLILVSSMSFASVRHVKCKGQLASNPREHTYAPGSLESIALEGGLVGDWIKDARATVVYENYRGQKVASISRARELDSDQEYSPRKWKGYMRFDLSKLTSVQDFSNFWPADSCQILIMMPKNAEKPRHFPAHIQIRCDQSGGVGTLNCSVR